MERSISVAKDLAVVGLIDMKYNGALCCDNIVLINRDQDVKALLQTMRCMYHTFL
jgi:hypothetical protein